MPEESNKLITEGAKISNQNTGETDSNQPEFYYELSLWFYPSFTEAEINEKFNSLIKNIEALNGVILSMESPQLRPLSYEILDNNNGFWGFIMALSVGHLRFLKFAKFYERTQLEEYCYPPLKDGGPAFGSAFSVSAGGPDVFDVNKNESGRAPA